MDISLLIFLYFKGMIIFNITAWRKKVLNLEISIDEMTQVICFKKKKTRGGNDGDINKTTLLIIW